MHCCVMCPDVDDMPPQPDAEAGDLPNIPEPDAFELAEEDAAHDMHMTPHTAQPLDDMGDPLGDTALTAASPDTFSARCALSCSHPPAPAL